MSVPFVKYSLSLTQSPLSLRCIVSAERVVEILLQSRSHLTLRSVVSRKSSHFGSLIRQVVVIADDGARISCVASINLNKRLHTNNTSIYNFHNKSTTTRSTVTGYSTHTRTTQRCHLTTQSDCVDTLLPPASPGAKP